MVDERSRRIEYSRKPETQQDADVERIASYLDGDEATVLEVDRWIRREIETRYPVLRGEVDDLCQIVHGKLLANLQADRFQRQSRLRTYVARIANYTAIDSIRGLYRDRALAVGQAHESESGWSSPYRLLESREESDLLRQALLHSSAACRELWRMVFVDRASYEEIGRRLSIPPGTVKSRMWHCRRKAQALLERFRRFGSTGPMGGR